MSDTPDTPVDEQPDTPDTPVDEQPDTPDTPVDEQPAVVEIEQTHNPADVMVPGQHLPCGGVNFRRGMCRDGYLGRHSCEACAPVAVEAKPAKRASKRSG